MSSTLFSRFRKVNSKTRLLRRMSENGSMITVLSVADLFRLSGSPAQPAFEGMPSSSTGSAACVSEPQCIRVNNIVLGYIRSQKTVDSYAGTGKRDLSADRTVFARWGDVDDLIGAAIYLASSASEYVTTTDSIVDGGYTARGLK